MAKLTKEQKIEIYKRKLKGETLKSPSANFDIVESKIKYLVKLLEKHGYNIFRNGKNHYYSEEFKKIVIDHVLLNKESVNSVAIDIGLTSSSILHNWVKKYKENCYNVIEKPRGRTKLWLKKSKKLITKNLL